MSQPRSVWVVGGGWLLTFSLYVTQMIILVTQVAQHHAGGAFEACIGLYLLVIIPLIFFFRKNWDLKYADEDEKVWSVWGIWATYILAYVVTIAMIFCKVTDELTKEQTLGINALKAALCITPILLLLLLQLTICPSYRKPVLSLSLFAALNIFDGIEMLEIVLMKNQGQLDLNDATEKAIISFACICFLLSPLGLIRNKFEAEGQVKERERTSMYLCPIEIIGTNLPFLVIRGVVWGKYEYEAAVFIAKNIISLVAGAVEFCILKKLFEWGE